MHLQRRSNGSIGLPYTSLHEGFCFPRLHHANLIPAERLSKDSLLLALLASDQEQEVVKKIHVHVARQQVGPAKLEGSLVQKLSFGVAQL